MPRISFASLRVRLVTLVLLAVIPALVLILYTGFEQHYLAAVTVQKEVLRLTRLAAYNQERLVEGVHQLLVALAQLPQVRDSDAAACQTLLANLLKQYSVYANLGVIGLDGVVYCSAIPPSSPANLSDRVYFRQALETRAFAAGDYQVGRISGKATLNFGYPVLDEKGQPQAVVFAALDLAWLNQVLRESHLPAGAVLTVIDRHGTILARYPDPQQWVGKSLPEAPLVKTILGQGEGAAQVTGLDGIPRLYAFTPLGEEADLAAGVYVTIGIPTTTAFAEVDQILVRQLVGVALVGLLALAAAWFGGEVFLVRRVKALVTATQRLRTGDLSARTGLPRRGQGELSQLAQAFDAMVEALQQREVERQQAAAEISQRQRELLALQLAGATVASSLDLQSVLDTVAREMAALLEVEGCVISEWHQADDTVVAVAVSGSAARRQSNAPAVVYRLADFPLTRRVLFERYLQQMTLSQPEIDPAELAYMQTANLKTLLLLPLEFQDQVIGLAEIEDTRVERAFTEPEVGLVQMLANQAASAIKNAHMHAETERRAEQLAVLHELDQAISANLHVDGVYHALARHTSRLISYDRVSITLLEGENLRVTYAADQAGTDQPTGMRWPLKASVSGWVVTKGQPLLRHHITAERRFVEDEQLVAWGLQSSMILPLRIKGQIIGTWNISSHQLGHYGPDDLEIAQALADQLAIAIKNARLYEQARQEIAERQRAETALAAERNLLRTLIDNLPDYIYVKDSASRFMIGNIAVTRLMGAASPDELVGKTDFDFFSPELAGQYYADEQAVVGSGQALIDREEPAVDQTTGHKKWLSTTKVPLRDQHGQTVGLVGMGRDMTERRHLEEQLRQSQKMEAVGRLAGGIAHDFNNLMLIVTGYSELLLQRHLSDDSSFRRYTEAINQAGNRAAGLTRQLLAFSRKQVFEPQTLDLNEVMTELDKLLQRLIDADINLVTVPQEGLGRVKADPGQLEQVIMNLVINARDAMPQGGNLTIETANVELDAAYARRHVEVTPGPYVLLAVSDTGIGMDQETLAHIFEPFFTTKGPDKGTGLGLATVYGIVNQSGGHVWVYSEPGRGTTFKIYLPRVAEAGISFQPNLTCTETPPGSETILLVEDEAGVRQFVHQVLAERGYTLLEASNGNEALQLGQQHLAPIHLLLTDVVLPGGMNGCELAERLALLQPELKVLYMSGYTDEAIIRHGVLEGGTLFLQKPFTPAALARKVREVLDTPWSNSGS